MKLIAGFNPAWQQVYGFDCLTVDAVNRANFFVECPSGKGINVLRGLQELGDQAEILQFLAGQKGQEIARRLHQEQIISHHVIDLKSETRTCTTVLNYSEATELIGPTSLFSKELGQEMLEKISQLPNYQAIAISGTLPTGISNAVYKALIDSQPEARIILDAYKVIKPLLSNQIYLLKINQEELHSLADEKNISKAIDKILATGVKNILVTNGSRSATLASTQGRSDIPVFSIAHPVNPIGAGNSATAYLLHQIENINSFADLKTVATDAMTFASKSCNNTLPGYCKDK